MATVETGGMARNGDDSLPGYPLTPGGAPVHFRASFRRSLDLRWFLLVFAILPAWRTPEGTLVVLAVLAGLAILAFGRGLVPAWRDVLELHSEGLVHGSFGRRRFVRWTDIAGFTTGGPGGKQAVHVRFARGRSRATVKGLGRVTGEDVIARPVFDVSPAQLAVALEAWRWHYQGDAAGPPAARASTSPAHTPLAATGPASFAIQLTGRGDALPPTGSRIGGRPYCEADDVVPHDSGGQPMAMLLQVHWPEVWSEVPEQDRDRFAARIGLDLPRSGLTQVFVTAHDDAAGANQEDAPFAQVDWRLVHRDDVDDARAVPVPSESVGRLAMPTDRCIALSFMPVERSPSCIGGDPSRDEDVDDEGDDEDVADGEKQHGEAQIPDPYDPRSQRGWRTLFQLDSDVDFDVMWWDAGTGYWFIRPEDLARRDFSRVHFTFTTG